MRLDALCALLALTDAGVANAQCGAPTSSCRHCHETEAQAPPSRDETWHADHAFGDFCGDCHGGTPTAADEASAHAGLVDPLGPPGAARCIACHEDAQRLADRYRDARRARASSPPSLPSREPKKAAQPPGERSRPNRSTSVVAGLLAVLAFAGGALVVRNERRRRGLAGAPIVPRPADAEWSPYVAGALLGLVAAVSMTFFGHRLSGGGAYQQIAGPLGRLASPASVYFSRVISGGARWELTGLAGAVLGAFAASRASGTFRIRTMPDSQWSEAFGKSVVVRWVVGFCGAALTEFASGIAGGCTASLAISGGAALAPGAFAFMAGMFAGGIPAAWLVYRRGAP